MSATQTIARVLQLVKCYFSGGNVKLFKQLTDFKNVSLWTLLQDSETSVRPAHLFTSVYFLVPKAIV